MTYSIVRKFGERKDIVLANVTYEDAVIVMRRYVQGYRAHAVSYGATIEASSSKLIVTKNSMTWVYEIVLDD